VIGRTASRLKSSVKFALPIGASLPKIRKEGVQESRGGSHNPELLCYYAANALTLM